MTDDATSVRVMLAHLEQAPTCSLAARALEATTTVTARAAFHAAGALAPSPPMQLWRCERRECAREVRGAPAGSDKPLVAVCAHAPPECEPIDLGFDDVAQHRTSLAALIERVAASLSIALAPGAVKRTMAIGELPTAPLRLGTRGSSDPCDVFWCRNARDEGLPAFLANRERAARRTLVIAPTHARIAPDLAGRYARGDRVELLVLEDVLLVRGGELVIEKREPPTLRLLAVGTAANTSARAANVDAPKQAALPARTSITPLAPASWNDVTMTLMRNGLVRIDVGGKSVRVGFAELGMKDRRTGDPSQTWRVFENLLQTGEVRPNRYTRTGRPGAQKKVVERLRAALETACGIASDPFYPYSSVEGWRPRFKIERR